MNPAPSPFPDTPVWRLYLGHSTGLLTWPDIDTFWETLARNPSGWFVYDLSSTPPKTPLPEAGFPRFLDTAKTLVNTRRELSHSGAVYTNNRATPTLVKIFDPSNMGTSCGGGHALVLPRYILSKIPPDPKPEHPPEKKSFLGRLILNK